EELTMAGHWRVDWIFSPAKGGGSLHVFIYSVEPRVLLYEVVGTQNGGADSSFWSGNGRFFLKINADRGDWKVAVQELRLLGRALVTPVALFFPRVPTVVISIALPKAWLIHP